MHVLGLVDLRKAAFTQPMHEPVIAQALTGRGYKWGLAGLLQRLGKPAHTGKALLRVLRQGLENYPFDGGREARKLLKEGGGCVLCCWGMR